MASVSSYRQKQRKRSSARFKRFLQWWGRELAALVPPAFLPRKRPPSRMLWAGMESGVLVLWRLAGRGRTEVGRVNLTSGDAADHKIAFQALYGKEGARPLGICLDPSQALRKEVALPLAATENLAQVLGYELGRLTPFTADQAYYDQRLLQEDRARNQARVLLGVVSRGVVDEHISRFAEWELTPQFVAVSDELESGGDCLNLLPVSLRPKPSRAGLWLVLSMAVITLVLFAVLLGIPLWKKREAVIALQPVLAQARQQAEVVEGIRREQTRLLAEYNFASEQKLVQPARIAVLEELSRILPDNTWLQQLDIRGTDISMQGYTNSSAKLIGLFEKSTLIENAHFKSPLVKVQGSEERFQLDASIKTQDLAHALSTQRGLLESGKPALQKGVKKR